MAVNPPGGNASGGRAPPSPDELTLLLPNGGEVMTEIAIPDAQALVGIVLQQQVAVAELGAGGVVNAVTSTNALVLTIGSF